MVIIKVQKSKEIKYLFLIFFFAVVLRLYNLNNLPYGFHEDELSNTYVGRFILENGKDLHGNSWPLLYFDKFGDYPPVFPMYFSGLSTYFFGINEFAARFPTALFGALTVFPLYYLTLSFFKDKKTGLISAVLLSIAPWHLVYSRSNAEGIIALFFFLSGLLSLFKGIEAKKKILLFFGYLCISFTYFLYPSFRLLVPLTFIPLPFFVDRKEKKIRKLLLIFLLISTLFTFWISRTAWGRARFDQTSLFGNSGIAAAIKARNEAFSFGAGQNNILEARFFHNKIAGYAREFLHQYLSYFSPINFYFEGGEPYRYFSIPQQGFFYFTFMLLFLAGLFFLLKKTEPKKLYLIYLTAVSVLPAALTVDFTPHFHRSILMLIPIIMIISYGYHKLTTVRIGMVYPKAIISLLLFFELLYFSHQYIRQSDSFKPGYKNDGNREAVMYIKNNEENYDSILMPSKEKLAVYYLFYSNDFSPSYIGQFGYNLTLEKIGKITFIDEWCSSKKMTEDKLNQKILVVDNGDCGKPSFLKEIYLIKRKDSTNAFRFLTNNK